ncbi:membrane lipoprotein lipid attachment site-containing protein [Aliarcobacter cryaerophilus]|uniref:membrane lipoprotein lipid attachment site-containing protein n=1 Tax=Aliarcobacter cryaerophilus TaxID=28198 RepID=UPI0031737A49
MKKIIFGMAISLAFLLSGCSENEALKKDKEEFIKSAEWDFTKAKKEALKTSSNEQIQKWIDESPRLKQLEKEYADFESRKNKHIDFSKFDWSLKPDDKVKK